MGRFGSVSIALLIAAAASSAALAAPDGKNRKITVINLSAESVREIYASPVTAKTWEEDLLGQRTLSAGSSISANVDNGTDECYYDLKAVLASGKQIVQRKINVCAVTKWTLGASGDTIE